MGKAAAYVSSCDSGPLLITVSSFTAPRTIDPSAKKPLTLDELATPSKQALERAFAPVCVQPQELSQALSLLNHLRRFSLAW